MDLLVRAQPKQTLLGASEITSVETFSNTWSEVTGKESEVEEMTVEWLDKVVPGGFGRELAESVAGSAEFGWGDTVLHSEVS